MLGVELTYADAAWDWKCKKPQVQKVVKATNGGHGAAVDANHVEDFLHLLPSQHCTASLVKYHKRNFRPGIHEVYTANVALDLYALRNLLTIIG